MQFTEQKKNTYKNINGTKRIIFYKLPLCQLHYKGIHSHVKCVNPTVHVHRGRGKGGSFSNSQVVIS